MRKCKKCGLEKLGEEFHLRTTKSGIRRSTCKLCENKAKREYHKSNKEYRERVKIKQKEISARHFKNNKEMYSARNAKRRASLLQRTIGNFDKEINKIYKNRPPGYHVDHIIPLQGKNVSGLHVPHNLQYLPASENLSKGNKV